MANTQKTAPARATGGRDGQARPNILVIWGDDIGITNLSCYSDGVMGYRTPNIDRIANEGMRFTDSYGEQSCTAGRASFITGQSGFRTGLTKVGTPGATVGLQAEDATIAELLKDQGYATGQFGKNHLGDRNEYLPTVHGFDEFFGNLYHLNAEEEPELPDWPSEKDFPEFRKKYRSTRRPSLVGDGQGRLDDRCSIWPCRQAEDRRHRPVDQEAHGNVRRRLRCGREGLHHASTRRRRPLLRVAQHDAHACAHASEARQHRTGGSVAVGISRYDDRPRQAASAKY